MSTKSENKKLRVGVLMGGLSIEREVSFNSGRTVCDHLDTSRYEVVPLFQDEDGSLYILPLYFLHRGKIADFQYRLEQEAESVSWDQLSTYVDFIYIAVHGRFAEDGTLQGLLEVFNIPYLGAKVFGSALGMDKIVQKELLQKHGISTPPYTVVKGAELETISSKELAVRLENAHVTFPCVVKPAHEGSSLGTSLVLDKKDLLKAVRPAATIDAKFIQDVLIEQKIEGMEFVNVSLEKISSRDGQPFSEWFSLPPTEVIPEPEVNFFDYEQKYMPGRATKITPARCSQEQAEAIAATCHKVAKVLHFSTIARIDGMLTGDGKIIIFDPNSLTGMGPATFLFHQAAEYGMSHAQLINFLIETELKRYGMISLDDAGIVQGASVSDREQKMRVAVLFGGGSNEREISLESGRNVCYKLSPQKYEVIPLFVDDEMKLYHLSQKLLIKNSTREIADLLSSEIKVDWSKLPQLCDFVFIALHGGKGENGVVQGMLEMLGIPYNGSGVLASAMCMDKYKTNLFLHARGFAVPNALLVEKDMWVSQQSDIVEKISSAISFPCIVKPFDDGCSVFVEQASNESEVTDFVSELFDKGKTAVLVEEKIAGVELTCGVYGNDEIVVMPPSQVVAKGSILSIQEKFLPGDGNNITPAPLDENALNFVKSAIASCYQAISCKGYARIDCFYQDASSSPTGEQRLVILEINSLPALTPATCLFHQAAEIGLRPMDLIDRIVDCGLQLHGRKNESVKVNSSIIGATSADDASSIHDSDSDELLATEPSGTLLNQEAEVLPNDAAEVTDDADQKQTLDLFS